MSTPKEQEFEIYSLVIDQGETKASVARKFNISPRTVGRIIDRVNEWQYSTRHAIATPTQTDLAFEEYEPTTDVTQESQTEESQSGNGFNQEYLFCIMACKSIHITQVSPDGTDTVMIYHDNPRYHEFLDYITTDDFSHESLRYVFQNANTKNIIKYQFGRISLSDDCTTVTYTNDDNEKIQVSSHIAKDVIEAFKLNDFETLNTLIKFTEKLMENCSYKSIKNAYQFLTRNNIKIDEDGFAIAYKSVTLDYKDHRTETFDNSVGSVVTEARNKIDDNADNECSNGLHVSDYSYAKGFYESSRRIVKVKVDPKDIVACTADENYRKMRVCRYVVLEDVTED